MKAHVQSEVVNPHLTKLVSLGEFAVAYINKYAVSYVSLRVCPRPTSRNVIPQ